jgi:hypothetical protein
VSVDAERERYNLHNNSMENSGYVQYLNAVANGLNTIPGHPLRILDFGSGANFVLTRLLRERGHVCDAYDPLYGLDIPFTNSIYDCIILCESIEHLRNLPHTLELLSRVITAHGSIIIKTQLYTDDTEFDRWWYAQDITHINFFNAHTMHIIAEKLNRRVIVCDNRDTVILGT